MRKKISRKFFTFGAAALIAVALAYAFRPLPLEVDMEEVVRRPMTLTVDEEGRTRVRDAYTVSAPVDYEIGRASCRERV